MSRPSETELWASVEATVRNVLLPAIEDEWARLAAIQLVSLATYARTRGPDPAPDLAGELAVLTDDVTALLVGSVGRDDELRDRVRERLVANLDADLAETMVMLDGFRGKLPDA